MKKRYYRIKRHEEDRLTIPALLHALSQLDPQWKLFISPIRATPWSTIKYKREQALRRKLWEYYAVKFAEHAERLRNPSGRFSERMFQISAFRARTESIKTMV
jgi:hypothetical protein